MWKFEDYIKEHKIAVLGVVKCLAEQYENIDYWHLYRPLECVAEKRMFKLYEHLPGWLKRKVNRGQWYGEWKNCIASYDTIVIGNALRGRDLIEYIQERNSTARIIVHFESLIGEANRKDPRRYKGLRNLEFCTFDKGDSEQWGIRYVPFYYDPAYYDPQSLSIDAWKKAMQGTEPIRDVFFIGSAFDRAERLVKLHHAFEEQGIEDKMVIVKNPHHRYSKKLEKYLTNQRMTYSEVVQDIVRSRCVLEVLQGGQQGMSLRPMEAAFFGKKLITDNKNAVQYDFYGPDKVFIIGVDSMSDLKRFISSPFQPVPHEILARYTPEYWLDSLLFGREEAEKSAGFDNTGGKTV